MKKIGNPKTILSAALSFMIGSSAFAQNMPPYTHGEPYKTHVTKKIKDMLPPAELSVLGKLGYSTKDFESRRPVPSGQLPKGMEVSRDGKSLFISDMGGTKLPNGKVKASVTIIDLITYGIEKVFTPNGLGKEMPGNTEMLFTIDGKYALSTQFEGSLEGLKCANDPNKGKNNRSAVINIIDVATHKVLAYVPTGGQGSKIMAERPKQAAGEPTIIYVANWFGNNVGVINLEQVLNTPKNCPEQTAPLATAALLKTIPFPTTYGKTAPRGIGFTLDGKYAIVLGYENGTLQVVDAQKHTRIAEVPPYPMNGFNVRHIILNNEGTIAYLSHMRGDAVSRVDISKLILETENAREKNPGKTVYFDSGIWDRIFIPFVSKTGTSVNMLPLESYSPDHPEFANLKFLRSHPNTIYLDPTNNRYLYVSQRTTGMTDVAGCRTKTTPRERLEGGCDIYRDLMGKVDMIDTKNGQVVISLVGGISPTALAVSHDGKTMMSSGFRDDKIYFYNVGKAKELYEKSVEGQ